MPNNIKDNIVMCVVLVINNTSKNDDATSLITMCLNALDDLVKESPSDQEYSIVILDQGIAELARRSKDYIIQSSGVTVKKLMYTDEIIPLLVKSIISLSTLQRYINIDSFLVDILTIATNYIDLTKSKAVYSELFDALNKIKDTRISKRDEHETVLKHEIDKLINTLNKLQISNSVTAGGVRISRKRSKKYRKTKKHRRSKKASQ